jgi:hypothetical protein
MKQNLAQKRTNKKPQKWTCKICDYLTSHKGSFIRHKSTLKHKKKENETSMKQNAQKRTTASFECKKCKLFFKSRTTLWRHKKICIYCNISKKNEITKKIGKNEINLVSQNKSEFNILISKLQKQEKEKEELWKAFHEQQELLKQTIRQNSEIIPRIGNNNNNNISINLILNEKCKNAMNIEDFLEKLHVSLDDLMYTKENGYVKGLSNIMVKHLKDLPPNDRPIHCSNQNRLQFYVKDENMWGKDENNKMNKSINEIQKKQVLKIKDWTDKHPNYCDDDELYLEYQQLVQSTMCVDNDDNKDIKKHISNVVNIDDVVNE